MKRKVNILCAVLCGMVPFWLALVWLARRNPDGVERIYSQGFYPLWAGGLMAVTSALPFSLAEVLVNRLPEEEYSPSRRTVSADSPLRSATICTSFLS